jgi:hypothetical protein
VVLGVWEVSNCVRISDVIRGLQYVAVVVCVWEAI